MLLNFIPESCWLHQNTSYGFQLQSTVTSENISWPLFIHPPWNSSSSFPATVLIFHGFCAALIEPGFVDCSLEFFPFLSHPSVWLLLKKLE